MKKFLPFLLIGNFAVASGILKTEIRNQLKLIEAHVKNGKLSEDSLREVRSELDTILAKLGSGEGPVSWGRDCVSELIEMRPGWSSSSLKEACRNVNADCVLDLAKARPGWSSSSLNEACKGNSENCAGKLAELRPGWSSSSLHDACSNMKVSCILKVAEKNMGWSSSSLRDACSK